MTGRECIADYQDMAEQARIRHLALDSSLMACLRTEEVEWGMAVG